MKIVGNIAVGVLAIIGAFVLTGNLWVVLAGLVIGGIVWGLTEHFKPRPGTRAVWPPGEGRPGPRG